MPFSDETPAVEMLRGRRVRVLTGFTYTTPEDVGRLPVGAVVEIPAGLESDLASIPRPLWPLLPPNGDYAPAAIVHDRLYGKPSIGEWRLDRSEADGVMLCAMKELGVSWYTRWTIHAGLRLGGWLRWNELRAAEVA